ncbi:MAG: hypothetical protein IBX61_03285 [Thermoleophilia bacterium]|nr:hypothetical protein [Thermoleophilia bacterium]
MAVDGYLAEVGRIQQISDAALLDLNEVLEDLGRTEAAALEEAVSRLEEKRLAVEAGRVEIEELKTPPAAQPLREHLLELYAEGSQVLGELIGIGNYRKRMEPVSAAYEEAAGEFAAQARQAESEVALTAAIEAFAGTISHALVQAEEMTPPASASLEHGRFLDNLDSLGSGLQEVIAGIASGDQGRIDAASADLSEVFGNSEAVREEIRQERRADVAGFNARIERMKELSQLIMEDQVQLRMKFGQ